MARGIKSLALWVTHLRPQDSLIRLTRFTCSFGFVKTLTFLSFHSPHIFRQGNTPPASLQGRFCSPCVLQDFFPSFLCFLCFILEKVFGSLAAWHLHWYKNGSLFLSSLWKLKKDLSLITKTKDATNKLSTWQRSLLSPRLSLPVVFCLFVCCFFWACQFFRPFYWLQPHMLEVTAHLNGPVASVQPESHRDLRSSASAQSPRPSSGQLPRCTCCDVRVGWLSYASLRTAWLLNVGSA